MSHSIHNILDTESPPKKNYIDFLWLLESLYTIPLAEAKSQVATIILVTILSLRFSRFMHTSNLVCTKEGKEKHTSSFSSNNA